MPASLTATLRAVCILTAVTLLPACAANPDRVGASNEPALAAIGDGTLAPGRHDLVVRGMSCPKCISNVDLQLKRIDGVVDPQVDMKNGRVVITVREGASPSRAAVARAIEDAGFTLAEIRSDAAGGGGR
jgi:copper chaperone CopZ